LVATSAGNINQPGIGRSAIPLLCRFCSGSILPEDNNPGKSKNANGGGIFELCGGNRRGAASHAEL